MKRIAVLLIFCLMVFVLAATPILAASPVNKADKGPVDKIVFVHYPKHQFVKPEKPVVSPVGTGVLCPEYKYTGVRWASGAVSYWINDDSGVSGAYDAIEKSMETWDNAAAEKLDFICEGAIDVEAGIYDGKNVVSWVDITEIYPGAIAVTNIWYNRITKRISEVDTQMNSGEGFVWNVTISDDINDLSSIATSDLLRYSDPTYFGPVEAFDIQNIMTHEAGHWLMLGDLYRTKHSELTMYGYGSEGEIKKDTLAYGDELGLETAYK